MHIAPLIRDNMQDLTRAFEQVARRQMPAASALEQDELRSSLHGMLTAIADDLDCAGPHAQQRLQARHEPARHVPQLSLCAQRHATKRLEHGLTMQQLLAEFRALRASLTRLLQEHAPDIDAVVRLNESVDQALHEAVNWYSREVERTRELFLGALGHDLRTPLATLSMSAELLLRDEGLNSRSMAAVVRVKNCALRMGRLVEDLIDFTRTRLGTRLPTRRAAADLGEVVRETVEDMRTLHPNRDIVLDSVQPLWGQWDTGRIGQLMSNLIGNAVQHGDASGPVRACAWREGDWVYLSVHNHGQPIPRRERDHIFQPLARFGAEVEPGKRASVGLGLYVCREIAKAHGGWIDVVSSAAEGTTFTVKLPATNATTEDAAAG